MVYRICMQYDTRLQIQIYRVRKPHVEIQPHIHPDGVADIGFSDGAVVHQPFDSRKFEEPAFTVSSEIRTDIEHVADACARYMEIINISFPGKSVPGESPA